jgi:hypothetical protein
MSFLDTSSGGYSKLWSKTIIDADKDMGGFGLSDLSELAATMNPGDLLWYNASAQRIQVLTGSTYATNELLTQGTAHMPNWGFPDTGKYP